MPAEGGKRVNKGHVGNNGGVGTLPARLTGLAFLESLFLAHPYLGVSVYAVVGVTT